MIYHKLSKFTSPEFPHRFLLVQNEINKFVQYVPSTGLHVTDADFMKKWLNTRPLQDEFATWCRDTIGRLPMVSWTVVDDRSFVGLNISCALYFRTASDASMFKLAYGGI